ncbi:MAG: hypothetical protein WD294_11980 [Phycisphaeraceae bacterium]
MNAQPLHPQPNSRHASIAHWVLWGLELSVLLPILWLATAISWDVSQNLPSPLWPLKVLIIAVTVGAIVMLTTWFVRKIRAPLDMRRLQQATTGFVTIVFVLTIIYGRVLLEHDPSKTFFSSPLFAMSLPLVWIAYRLLFVGLKRWTQMPETRSDEERLAPAKQFLGLLAAIAWMATINVYQDAMESHPTWAFGALLGTYLLYRIATAIVARRIARTPAGTFGIPQGGAA